MVSKKEQKSFKHPGHVKIDFSKIGLKCGLEIHQQLSTKKLFCRCSSGMKEENLQSEFERKMRPVAGETGEIDIAAMHETLRNRTFVYHAYDGEACLVDSDESPPETADKEALETALSVSLMFNLEIPEELHAMRKAVLDGSACSSFQRTLVVGTEKKGSGIKTSKGLVNVTTLCLEEDACKIEKTEGNIVHYSLSRQGIPLLELRTDPDIKSPDHALETAKKIGLIFRSFPSVRRGIGTIRQDINVSISGGARIEIKGAQDLRMIPKLVENEALRQMSLLEIKKDLKRMKFKPVKPRVLHVSHIFKESKSRITKGKTTYAIFIPDFAGFLKRKLTPTRTLGNEIANYVRVKSELKGIIHSDEDLGKYELSKEFDSLREHMKAKKGDTLIIAVGEKEPVGKTMKIVCERINQLIEGIPAEVRRVLENGDTEYMRPLPGAARLYPETDIPPIKITSEKLREIRKNLPELIEEKERKEKKEIRKKAKISDEIIDQIVKMKRKETFDNLLKSGFDPKTVSSVLTSTLRYLEKREKVDISKLSDSHFLETFKALKAGKIPKEAIPDVLKAFAEHPDEKIGKITEKLGLKTLSESELKETVKKIIQENMNLLKDPRGEKILLGLVMKKVRGRADARKVMDILESVLKKI